MSAIENNLSQTQLLTNNNASDSMMNSSFSSSIPTAPTVPAIFAYDVEQNLGRANGNVYFSKPGIDQVHDGQIMVRLKKKRCIIIDYGLTAENCERDIAAGAGVDSKSKICNTVNCNKIGVPVLLYDSAPYEPSSLYLRSGLCFTCQRVLNEKRRSQRKRKGNDCNNVAGSNDRQKEKKKQALYDSTSNEYNTRMNLGDIGSSVLYMLGSDVPIPVPNDAIIIYGPIGGTKPFGPGYGMKEISKDIRKLSQEIANDSDQLFVAVENALGASTSTPCNVNQSSTGDSSMSTTNHGTVFGSDLMDLNDDATFGVESLPTENLSSRKVNDPEALYEKTLQDMKKSIFLLTQWKSSWDTMKAVIQQKYDNNNSNDYPIIEVASSLPSEQQLQDQQPPQHHPPPHQHEQHEEPKSDSINQLATDQQLMESMSSIEDAGATSTAPVVMPVDSPFEATKFIERVERVNSASHQIISSNNENVTSVSNDNKKEENAGASGVEIFSV